MLSLCVTTLNRQDLLVGCLRSAFEGSVKPEAVYIVDQAGDATKLWEALAVIPVPATVVHLGEKQGCEASAINWYLWSVPEERIIAHDDVVFGPTSLEQFVNTPGDFLIDVNQGVLTYRDTCKIRAGFYDPTISPNFYRYVDVDYEDRLAMVGIHPIVVDCGIQHLVNGTLKGYSLEAEDEYLRRQYLAHVNYTTKWGREVTPGGTTIGRGQWRREHQDWIDAQPRDKVFYA